MNTFPNGSQGADKHKVEALIVVCGSMTHYSLMSDLKEALEKSGMDVIIPENEDAFMPKQSNRRNGQLIKNTLSRRYFQLIRRKRVRAILVVNATKNGDENYIGANTFAEIVIATHANKRVYLLNGMSERYRDELAAWGAVPLKGNLDILVQDMKSLKPTATHQPALQFYH